MKDEYGYSRYGIEFKRREEKLIEILKKKTHSVIIPQDIEEKIFDGESKEQTSTIIAARIVLTSGKFRLFQNPYANSVLRHNNLQKKNFGKELIRRLKFFLLGVRGLEAKSLDKNSDIGKKEAKDGGKFSKVVSPRIRWYIWRLKDEDWFVHYKAAQALERIKQQSQNQKEDLDGGKESLPKTEKGKKYRCLILYSPQNIEKILSDLILSLKEVFPFILFGWRALSEEEKLLIEEGRERAAERYDYEAASEEICKLFTKEAEKLNVDRILIITNEGLESYGQGKTALVSFWELMWKYSTQDVEIIKEKIKKYSLHELAHTFLGERHCKNECLMNPLKLKDTLCEFCKKRLSQKIQELDGGRIKNNSFIIPGKDEHFFPMELMAALWAAKTLPAYQSNGIPFALRMLLNNLSKQSPKDKYMLKYDGGFKGLNQKDGGMNLDISSLKQIATFLRKGKLNEQRIQPKVDLPLAKWYEEIATDKGNSRLGFVPKGESKDGGRVPYLIKALKDGNIKHTTYKALSEKPLYRTVSNDGGRRILQVALDVESVKEVDDFVELCAQNSTFHTKDKEQKDGGIFEMSLRPLVGEIEFGTSGVKDELTNKERFDSIRNIGRKLLGGRLDGGSRKSLLFPSSDIQLSNRDGGVLYFYQLLQLIKGYKTTTSSGLGRISLNNKFSDGGNANDLFPAIQELSKDKFLRISRLSFQSPLFKLEGAEISPTINITMINNPMLILKEILNLAKNSVAKAAATITGKVLRINFVINHLFPSIDSKTITQKNSSVKLGTTVSISNSSLNQLLQLIKGYQNIALPELERISLNNKFSDVGITISIPRVESAKLKWLAEKNENKNDGGKFKMDIPRATIKVAEEIVNKEARHLLEEKLIGVTSYEHLKSISYEMDIGFILHFGIEKFNSLLKLLFNKDRLENLSEEKNNDFWNSLRLVEKENIDIENEIKDLCNLLNEKTERIINAYWKSPFTFVELLLEIEKYNTIFEELIGLLGRNNVANFLERAPLYFKLSFERIRWKGMERFQKEAEELRDDYKFLFDLDFLFSNLLDSQR
ncbi:MAG TPA: hypothetical protein ENG49_01005, partial [Candidatus Omnitrophica bacterium]|nr:hypothetical protein [Candidatus Omnitrophota bacterium]